MRPRIELLRSRMEYYFYTLDATVSAALALLDAIQNKQILLIDEHHAALGIHGVCSLKLSWIMTQLKKCHLWYLSGIFWSFRHQERVGRIIVMYQERPNYEIRSHQVILPNSPICRSSNQKAIIYPLIPFQGPRYFPYSTSKTLTNH